MWVRRRGKRANERRTREIGRVGAVYRVGSKKKRRERRLELEDGEKRGRRFNMTCALRSLCRDVWVCQSLCSFSPPLYHPNPAHQHPSDFSPSVVYWDPLFFFFFSCLYVCSEIAERVGSAVEGKAVCVYVCISLLCVSVCVPLHACEYKPWPGRYRH